MKHDRSTAALSNRVRVGTARNLTLLRAIEDTIDDVAGICSVLRGVEEHAQLLERRASEAGHEVEIDADDSLVRALVETQEACVRMHAIYAQRLAEAQESESQGEDDGLADAYESAVKAVRAAHDALGDLIFAIRQHDARASGFSGPFTSADDLIASLRS